LGPRFLSRATRPSIAAAPPANGATQRLPEVPSPLTIGSREAMLRNAIVALVLTIAFIVGAIVMRGMVILWIGAAVAAVATLVCGPMAFALRKAADLQGEALSLVGIRPDGIFLDGKHTIGWDEIQRVTFAWTGGVRFSTGLTGTLGSKLAEAANAGAELDNKKRAVTMELKDYRASVARAKSGPKGADLYFSGPLGSVPGTASMPLGNQVNDAEYGGFLTALQQATAQHEIPLERVEG
jgi:hypothetical protein